MDGSLRPHCAALAFLELNVLGCRDLLQIVVVNLLTFLTISQTFDLLVDYLHLPGSHLRDTGDSTWLMDHCTLSSAHLSVATAGYNCPLDTLQSVLQPCLRLLIGGNGALLDAI
jgi:hypothetical protein